MTETAAQEKADGKFFRFLRNRPGSLEGFCIFEVTTVRFRNPVNIGDHRSWVMSQGVVVEKEPVEWGFSQKA